MAADAAKIGLLPFKVAVRDIEGAKIARSESFVETPEVTVALGNVGETEAGWVLPLDADGAHTILFNNKELASLASAGLALFEGRDLSWNEILNIAVPTTQERAEELLF
jgi:hypothetical protein